MYSYDGSSQETLDISIVASAQHSSNPISITFPQHRGLSNNNDPPDSAVSIDMDLSWTPNVTSGTPFIIASTSNTQDDVPSLLPPNPPTDWMHANLPLLGCQPLRHICIPGSHDAGMSILTHSTFLSIPENTLTQWTDIAGQLEAGVRYFDTRPVISSGKFVQGHYSEIGSNWIGGNGQDLASMIEQVNTFLSTYNELVILDLSHMHNTDEDWRNLNPEEFARLLIQLEDLQHRYSGPTGPDSDLAGLPLNIFIANSPCVLVVISDSPVILPSSPPSGIFPSSALNIYNSYTNTPFAPLMAADQINKMLTRRTSRDSGMFLLSWTLTTPLDIRELAKEAHSILFQPGDTGLWSTIYRKRQKGAYPTIIMVDGLGSTDSRDVLLGGKLLTGFCIMVNSVVLEGVGRLAC